MTQPQSFEQDSTKAPLWLPLIGLVVFVAIALLAVMCPYGAPRGGEPPAPPPAEQPERPPTSP